MRGNGSFIVVVVCLFSQVARGEVLIDFDFQFTPRNHLSAPTATMPRWGSAVISLISTSGPILSVDFATPLNPEISRGIYGRLGQRWTSPGGGVYTSASPGPMNVANSQNDFSLDSHFFGDATTRLFTSGPEEGNVLFPGLNPVLSSPFVGYGSGVGYSDVQTQSPLGFLKGKFDLPPHAQAEVIDLCYLTYGGQVGLIGTVVTAGETVTFGAAIVFPEVPEPSFLSAMLPLFFAICHRRCHRLNWKEHAHARESDYAVNRES